MRGAAQGRRFLIVVGGAHAQAFAIDEGEQGRRIQIVIGGMPKDFGIIRGHPQPKNNGGDFAEPSARRNLLLYPKFRLLLHFVRQFFVIGENSALKRDKIWF